MCCVNRCVHHPLPTGSEPVHAVVDGHRQPDQVPGPPAARGPAAPQQHLDARPQPVAHHQPLPPLRRDLPQPAAPPAPLPDDILQTAGPRGASRHADTGAADTSQTRLAHSVHISDKVSAVLHISDKVSAQFYTSQTRLAHRFTHLRQG